MSNKALTNRELYALLGNEITKGVGFGGKKAIINIGGTTHKSSYVCGLTLLADNEIAIQGSFNNGKPIPDDQLNLINTEKSSENVEDLLDVKIHSSLEALRDYAHSNNNLIALQLINTLEFALSE